MWVCKVLEHLIWVLGCIFHTGLEAPMHVQTFRIRCDFCIWSFSHLFFIFGFCFKFHIQLAIAASLVVGVEWSWCLSLLILLMWPRIGILHAQVGSVVSKTSFVGCLVMGLRFHYLVPCWFPTSITMSFQVSQQLVLFNLALWLYLVGLCWLCSNWGYNSAHLYLTPTGLIDIYGISNLSPDLYLFVWNFSYKPFMWFKFRC